jgi:hypothetical protein
MEAEDFRMKWCHIQNDGVATGFRISGFRNQLVGNLVRRNRQQVLLIRQEQLVVLVEVEDEGGEK